MTSHSNHEMQYKKNTGHEAESNQLSRESLLNAMKGLHSAFSEGRALDMSNLFSEDAILMSPNAPDIVGRELIQQAFVGFMETYETEAFEPKQEIIDVSERRAVSLGNFIEMRTPRDGRPTEKIYGRLLEIWELSSEGRWEVIRMMTGRYSETEYLE
ncbi:MAG: YybH family protein [Promethearchaeota archaeon]